MIVQESHPYTGFACGLVQKMQYVEELTIPIEQSNVLWNYQLILEEIWEEIVPMFHCTHCQSMDKVIYVHYPILSWRPRLLSPLCKTILVRKFIQLSIFVNYFEKNNAIPWWWFQEAGVENKRRAPHSSQAMVSTSTLIQPLLAQLTALTFCKYKK